jgi:hypothetical protein
MAPFAQIDHEVQHNIATLAEREVLHRYALMRTVERNKWIRRERFETWWMNGSRPGQSETSPDSTRNPPRTPEGRVRRLLMTSLSVPANIALVINYVTATDAIVS